MMNVGAAIRPAWDWMVYVLFRPFRLRKWFALGFVALLAGSGGGGGNLNIPTGDDQSNPFGSNVFAWMSEHILLLVILGAILIIAGLVLSWICSVMKFVYTDQIVRNSMEIRAPFKRFTGKGLAYLIWQFVFSLVSLSVIFLLAGLPIIYVWVYAKGMAEEAQIAVTIVCALIGVALFILMALILAFGEQFLVPAMYVRGVGVIDGWQIVTQVVRRNIGQVILLLLLQLALGIAAAMGTMLAMLAIALVLAIPGALFFAIGYGIYEAGREAWTPGLITYVASIGFVFLVAFGYLLACALQPIQVFFRSLTLVVLGQADPSLATVPTGPQPYK